MNTTTLLPPAARFSGAYAEQSVATVHEAAGRIGALSSAVKPIAAGMKLSGPAFPFTLKPGDNLAIHEALYEAPAGSVLVIDAYDFLEAGPFGEIIAVAAQVRGIAGLVTSGSVRDRDAIAAIGFPVFAKGLCVKGTDKLVPARLGGAVVIDGVVVNPGDWVLGDADGVVVIPAAEAESVLNQSIEREAKERAIIERIRQGARTLDVYNFGGNEVAK
ncbi:RraA family protein [Variovorax humicola]|uniref:RraA family protein n=1 Tax=Variovorax humicola TaxID=1769758 RepID=A0ABU8WBP6_9BURK